MNKVITDGLIQLCESQKDMRECGFDKEITNLNPLLYDAYVICNCKYAHAVRTILCGVAIDCKVPFVGKSISELYKVLPIVSESFENNTLPRLNLITNPSHMSLATIDMYNGLNDLIYQALGDMCTQYIRLEL